MRKNKHLKIDQQKLTRVKRLLGAKTEQDAIEQALDAILAEETIDAMHRRIKGKAKLDQVFD